MSQLLLKIWVLLAIAAAMGVIVGWLIRAVGVRENERRLRGDIDAAQSDARAQRDEAARLAAKLQAETNAASSHELARLEAELRAAQAQADREAANAEDLRSRLYALEEQIASQGSAEAKAAPTSEAASGQDRGETARLRMEIARLKANLAANAVAEERAEQLDEARSEIRRLQGEVTRLTEIERELARMREEEQGRDGELSRAERLARAEATLRALAEGDEASYAALSTKDAPGWLHARLRWLEMELDTARSEAANATAATPAVPTQPDPPTDGQSDSRPLNDNEQALLSRVQQLEAELAEAKGGDALAADDPDSISDVTRLEWRNRYLTSRVQYLEERGAVDEDDRTEGEGINLQATDHLEAAEDEVARLRARVADLERRNEELLSLDSPSKADDNEGQPTEWRNRYLTSRVAYLERRVAELEGGDQHQDESARQEADRLRAQLAGAQAQADEAARLRIRVAELEAGAVSPGPAEEHGDRAIDWRNRYLTSRVKYLEERLAEATSVREGHSGPAETNDNSG